MSKDIPPIAEKVKFWEEQDKINQAVIPRIVEMNESIKMLTIQIGEVDKKISSTESRVQRNVKEELNKNIIELRTSISNLEKELNDLNLEVTARLKSIIFPKKYKIIIYVSILVSILSFFLTVIK